MGWTKQQLIDQAFDAIGLSSYEFNLTSDQYQSALRMLDSMMAVWNSRGIFLGYRGSFSVDDSSLSSDSGIPDHAIEGVYSNLSLRIATSYGKTVSQETKNIADSSYKTLLSISARPLPMSLPGTMPSGAGNKTWRFANDPFIRGPGQLIAADDSGVLNLG